MVLRANAFSMAVFPPTALLDTVILPEVVLLPTVFAASFDPLASLRTLRLRTLKSPFVIGFMKEIVCDGLDSETGAEALKSWGDREELVVVIASALKIRGGQRYGTEQRVLPLRSGPGLSRVTG